MDEKMKERIMRMANRTWDAIGGDVLVDDNGNPDESMSLPKDHVIEIVMDADHMMYHGGDEEAYKVYEKLSYEDKMTIMNEAFTYEYYGW